MMNWVWNTVFDPYLFSNICLDLDQEIPKEDTTGVNRVTTYSKTYCVGDYVVRDSSFRDDISSEYGHDWNDCRRVCSDVTSKTIKPGKKKRSTSTRNDLKYDHTFPWFYLLELNGMSFWNTCAQFSFRRTIETNVFLNTLSNLQTCSHSQRNNCSR